MALRMHSPLIGISSELASCFMGVIRRSPSKLVSSRVSGLYGSVFPQRCVDGKKRIGVLIYRAAGR